MYYLRLPYFTYLGASPRPGKRLECELWDSDLLTKCCQILQVRKFVIRREVQPKGEGKKPYTKAPKIQRLITPQRLQHKRHRLALKRRNAERTKDAAVSFFLDLIFGVTC